MNNNKSQNTKEVKSTKNNKPTKQTTKTKVNKSTKQTNSNNFKEQFETQTEEESEPQTYTTIHLNQNSQPINNPEQHEYEYFNYVKDPLEKMVYMIDCQINYFNIEDVFRSLRLVENLKENIAKCIEMLNDFDEILDERYIKIEHRKEVLFELNQLFIEHNKYNIAKRFNQMHPEFNLDAKTDDIKTDDIKTDDIKTDDIKTDDIKTKTTKKQ